MYIDTTHRCGHTQLRWVPRFKYQPGPEGQKIIAKHAEKLCSDCFFGRMEQRFGIRFDGA